MFFCENSWKSLIYDCLEAWTYPRVVQVSEQTSKDTRWVKGVGFVSFSFGLWDTFLANPTSRVQWISHHASDSGVGLSRDKKLVLYPIDISTFYFYKDGLTLPLIFGDFSVLFCQIFFTSSANTQDLAPSPGALALYSSGIGNLQKCWVQ